MGETQLSWFHVCRRKHTHAYKNCCLDFLSTVFFCPVAAAVVTVTALPLFHIIVQFRSFLFIFWNAIVNIRIVAYCILKLKCKNCLFWRKDIWTITLTHSVCFNITFCRSSVMNLFVSQKYLKIIIFPVFG